MLKPAQSKFKPCTTYRYLPGQISKSHNDIDLKYFNKHRLNVSSYLLMKNVLIPLNLI